MLALTVALMLLLWSFNYIAGKIALRHMDPISLACFRIELAAIIMLPIYFSRQQREASTARCFGRSLTLDCSACVVNQGLFTVGLNYTTSNHSAVIIAVGPIIVLLLARAMKLEAVTPAKIAGMAVAFAGVFLLEAENGSPAHSPFLMGDLITLCGTIGFSIYAVLGKKVAAEYDAIAMNTFNCVAAAIMLLPLTVRQGMHLDWGGGGVGGMAGDDLHGGSQLCGGLYAFLLGAAIYDALRGCAAISYFQPVAVILLSVAFLSEHPTRNLLLGTALVLLGVYLAERGTA